MRDADDVRVSEHLAELRSSFDLAFARPVASARAQTLRLLVIRVGADPFLVRLGEIDGIERTRHLVALPGAAPALLGVMGVRGALVPVYSLARLAGYDDGGGSEEWVLFTGGNALGLAVTAFVGYGEVVASEMASGGDSRRYVSGLARVAGLEMGVVDIASILEHVKRDNGALPRRS